MNKALKIVQAGLVILFALINIYFMLFNWNVYTVALEVDYGLGTFNAPLVIVLALTGLTFILLVWLVSYIKDLQSEVRVMKAKEQLTEEKNKTNGEVSSQQQSQLKEQIALLQQQMDKLEQKTTGDKSIEEYIQ